jgi:hypothetical protein
MPSVSWSRKFRPVQRTKLIGPDRIAGHLATVGDGSITIAPATVHRILMRHGISRLRDLDMPTGESGLR